MIEANPQPIEQRSATTLDDPFKDHPPVLEGGLHVGMTVRSLMELHPHIPMKPRQPMGCWWYASLRNSDEVAKQVTDENPPQYDEEGNRIILTHCQASFCLPDATLNEAMNRPQPAALIEACVRALAENALAAVKQLSPGGTDLHWIGPSRGPTGQ